MEPTKSNAKKVSKVKLWLYHKSKRCVAGFGSVHFWPSFLRGTVTRATQEQLWRAPCVLKLNSRSHSLSPPSGAPYIYIYIVASLRKHWMSAPQRILCTLALTLPSRSQSSPSTFKSRTFLFLRSPPPYITLARSLAFTSSFSLSQPIMPNNQVSTTPYHHCLQKFINGYIYTHTYLLSLLFAIIYVIAIVLKVI